MSPEYATAAERLRWDCTSARGPRDINADAAAANQDPATGRIAFAVADGVGDHPLAARAAALSAHSAVIAATSGDARTAILAAQRALLAEAPANDDGDTVLVVATSLSEADEAAWDIAWVGDCRAYYWNGRVLAQITADHTVAEYYRAHRMPVTPRMEHLVTTSVRTVAADQIGHTRTGPGSGRLLLCSDGVHKTLDMGFIRALLDMGSDPGELASMLVGSAHELGSRDNATALVIDTTAAEPGTHRAALAA